MKAFISCLLLCATILGANAQIDCSDKEDGVYGWGCRSFTQCTGGKGTLMDCIPPTEVFNPEIKACDLAENVPAPCGLQRDCTDKADGRYADHELECKSYYTCLNGLYYGHNPCAGGLVFDEKNQFCNWPSAVPEPCGTFVDEEQ